MRPELRAALLLGVCVAVTSACGGGSGPSGPSADTQRTVPAGTVLRFESGETGGPVADAAVTVAGQSYSTNSSGQLTLQQSVPIGSQVDVLTAAFLERHAFLDSASASAPFTLWPKTSPTGLNERFTELIAYTDAGDDPPPPVGSSPLTRLRRGSQRVVVELSPALERDPTARALHADYAAHISSATGSAVTYLLTSGSPGELVITAKVDPTEQTCRDDPLVRGFARLKLAGSEITGGTVVYCTVAAARSPTVGHELGHTFGLNHSSDRADLMFRYFSSRRSTRYSAREALAMRLMLQRKGGNRFPDDERDSGARAAPGVRVFVCS
jgi:hypothetical protein